MAYNEKDIRSRMFFGSQHFTNTDTGETLYSVQQFKESCEKCKSITDYGYIVHDNNHIHFFIRCKDATLKSTISNAIGVPMERYKTVGGRDAIADCFAYMLHEDPQSVAAGKVRYVDEEIHATEGLQDFRAKIDAKYHKDDKKLKVGELVDFYCEAITHGDMSLREVEAECIANHNSLLWANNHRKFEDCYISYGNNLPNVKDVEILLYIGKSCAGKSTLAELVALALQGVEYDVDAGKIMYNGEEVSLTPEFREKILCSAKIENRFIDNYDYTPQMLLDDVKAEDLKHVSKNDLKTGLFQTHPNGKKRTFPVKGKRQTCLCYNKLQVNTIDGDYRYTNEKHNEITDVKFIDEIAKGDNEGGRDTQFYRRMPIIIELHYDENTKEECIRLWTNKGVLEHNMYECTKYVLIQWWRTTTHKKRLEKDYPNFSTLAIDCLERDAPDDYNVLFRRVSRTYMLQDIVSYIKAMFEKTKQDPEDEEEMDEIQTGDVELWGLRGGRDNYVAKGITDEIERLTDTIYQKQLVMQKQLNDKNKQISPVLAPMTEQNTEDNLTNNYYSTETTASQVVSEKKEAEKVDKPEYNRPLNKDDEERIERAKRQTSQVFLPKNGQPIKYGFISYHQDGRVMIAAFNDSGKFESRDLAAIYADGQQKMGRNVWRFNLPDKYISPSDVIPPTNPAPVTVGGVSIDDFEEIMGDDDLPF